MKAKIMLWIVLMGLVAAFATTVFAGGPPIPPCKPGVNCALTK